MTDDSTPNHTHDIKSRDSGLLEVTPKLDEEICDFQLDSSDTTDDQGGLFSELNSSQSDISDQFMGNNEITKTLTENADLDSPAAQPDSTTDVDVTLNCTLFT